MRARHSFRADGYCLGVSMDDVPSFHIKQDKTSRVGKMARYGLLAVRALSALLFPPACGADTRQRCGHSDQA